MIVCRPKINTKADTSPHTFTCLAECTQLTGELLNGTAPLLQPVFHFRLCKYFCIYPITLLVSSQQKKGTINITKNSSGRRYWITKLIKFFVKHSLFARSQVAGSSYARAGHLLAATSEEAPL